MEPEVNEDTQLSKYDKPVYVGGIDIIDFKARTRSAWHNKESGAKAVKALLEKEVIPYEYPGRQEVCDRIWGRRLMITKELCIFEGTDFHSLKGDVWALADVEKCLASLQNASDDKVLELFGKYRREPKDVYSACFCEIYNCFCQLCCLDCGCACGDPYFGVSRRVKEKTPASN